MPDVPASKGYKDGFATRHMIKDLCLALAAAEHVDAQLPMGRKAKELYEQVGVCWCICSMICYCRVEC